MSVVVLVFVSVGVAVAMAMRMTVVVTMGVTVRVSVVMSSTLLSSQVVVRVTRVQNFHLNEVKDESHNCDNKHIVSLDLRRLEESHGGFTEKPNCHYPNASH